MPDQSDVEKRIEELEARHASEISRLQKEATATENARKSETQRMTESHNKSMSDMREQLYAARDEVDRLREEASYANELREKLARERLDHAEYSRNMEDQLAEQRALANNLEQKESDNKCTISILEHKLTNAINKMQHLDGLEHDNTQLKEKAASLERRNQELNDALSSETFVHQRDRKASEEKIHKLMSELQAERQGATKVELCERYENILSNMKKGLELVLSTGKLSEVSVPDVFTDAATQEFIENVLQNTVEMSNNVPLRGSSFNDAPLHIRVNELGNMLASLHVPKQERLLRRFYSTVEAHMNNSARFGDGSGLPDLKEDPAVLVNQIANLHAQIDLLNNELRNEVDGNDTIRASRPLGSGPGCSSTRFLVDVVSAVSVPLLEDDCAVFTLGNGHQREATLRVNSPTVSKTHFAIKCSKPPLPPVICDMGSEVGTYVNGTKVEGPTEIYPNDIIQLGAVKGSVKYKYVEQIRRVMVNAGAPERSKSPRYRLSASPSINAGASNGRNINSNTALRSVSKTPTTPTDGVEVAGVPRLRSGKIFAKTHAWQ